jgi:hypothetical protein
MSRFNLPEIPTKTLSKAAIASFKFGFFCINFLDIANLK